MGVFFANHIWYIFVNEFTGIWYMLSNLYDIYIIYIYGRVDMNGVI